MEIKEIIFEYLDNNYPIDGNVVTVDYDNIYTFRYVETIQQAKARTIDHWARAGMFDNAEFKEAELSSITTAPDKTERTTAIDKEIADMFGVEVDTYFWEWTESRIGNYITLQFKNNKVNFNKRIRMWGGKNSLFGDAKIKLPPFNGNIVDVP